MKSDEEELAFVIDYYRVPLPAAARRLLLQRAHLAQERRCRSDDPSSARIAGAQSRVADARTCHKPASGLRSIGIARDVI
jgi:hypothetical protein